MGRVLTELRSVGGPQTFQGVEITELALNEKFVGIYMRFVLSSRSLSFSLGSVYNSQQGIRC